jgi:outer membrane protein assembly factor BamB
VLAVKPDGSAAWGATLAAQPGTGGFVTSAPVVGKKAIWVGSDDGRIYAVKLDGSGLVPNGVCPVASNTATVGHLFTPLVYQLPSAQGSVPEEAVYTGGLAGKYYGLFPSASIPCVSPAFYSAEATMGASPVMTSSGVAFMAVGDPTRSTNVALLFTMNSQAPAQLDYQDYGVLAGAPLSMGLDGSGALLVADGAKEMNRLVVGSNATMLNLSWNAPAGPVQYGQEAMVVSSAGEPITGGRLSGAGGTGAVDRLTSAGKAVPDWPISLGPGSADVTGLALAAVDSSGVTLYATTSAGDLFALDQSGAAVWSTRSGSTQLLGTGKLDFPTIAPAVSGQALPTLYAGSADGHLYAVVVDSGLDPASPWPKAHHDLRNTGNAMPVRP